MEYQIAHSQDSDPKVIEIDDRKGKQKMVPGATALQGSSGRTGGRGEASSSSSRSSRRAYGIEQKAAQESPSAGKGQKSNHASPFAPGRDSLSLKPKPKQLGALDSHFSPVPRSPDHHYPFNKFINERKQREEASDQRAGPSKALQRVSPKPKGNARQNELDTVSLKKSRVHSPERYREAKRETVSAKRGASSSAVGPASHSWKGKTKEIGPSVNPMSAAPSRGLSPEKRHQEVKPQQKISENRTAPPTTKSDTLNSKGKGRVPGLDAHFLGATSPEEHRTMNQTRAREMPETAMRKSPVRLPQQNLPPRHQKGADEKRQQGLQKSPVRSPERPPLLRQTRAEARLQQAPPKSSRLDRNDVLFPYPLRGRADLSITKGDQYRLIDGDFLNDVFLEFGLRVILDQESTVPKEKVHLFNSFFYDKLSKKEKKGKILTEEGSWPGYDSVKKWTKTTDVFEKKFIIIPINESYHWFLAVIYNPGGILRKREEVAPPPNAVVSPNRPVTRSIAVDADQLDRDLDALLSEDQGEATTSAAAARTPQTSTTPTTTTSRLESEREGQDDFSKDPLDCLSDNDTDAEDVEEVSDKVENLSILQSDGDADPIALAPTPPPPPPPKPIRTLTLELFESQDNPPVRPLTPPRHVQAPSKPSASPRGGRREDRHILNSDTTWIMTFDSLGGAHRGVGNNLRRWLEFEARDKKKVDYVPSDAVYVEAKVPQQPNFSDCGVFLIHYVKCLLTDPDGVLRFIEKAQPHNVAAERDAWKAEKEWVWRARETTTLREEWAETIDINTQTWRSMGGHDGSAGALSTGADDGAEADDDEIVIASQQSRADDKDPNVASTSVRQTSPDRAQSTSIAPSTMTTTTSTTSTVSPHFPGEYGKIPEMSSPLSLPPSESDDLQQRHALGNTILSPDSSPEPRSPVLPVIAQSRVMKPSPERQLLPLPSSAVGHVRAAEQRSSPSGLSRRPLSLTPPPPLPLPAPHTAPSSNQDIEFASADSEADRVDGYSNHDVYKKPNIGAEIERFKAKQTRADTVSNRRVSDVFTPTAKGTSRRSSDPKLPASGPTSTSKTSPGWSVFSTRRSEFAADSVDAGSRNDSPLSGLGKSTPSGSNMRGVDVGTASGVMTAERTPVMRISSRSKATLCQEASARDGTDDEADDEDDLSSIHRQSPGPETLTTTTEAAISASKRWNSKTYGNKRPHVPSSSSTTMKKRPRISDLEGAEVTAEPTAESSKLKPMPGTTTAATAKNSATKGTATAKAPGTKPSGATMSEAIDIESD